MGKAIFRFYEELNDFLPEQRRKKDFTVEFGGEKSVMDMIEALGVPCTKVDLVLANGETVGFDYILREGDRFSVYPVFESLNIQHIARLRDMPLRKTRFIADPSLGDIVNILRLLGFDVYTGTSLSEREMMDISNRENRIILTKDDRLLTWKDVTHAITVGQGTAEEQVRGILDRLDIPFPDPSSSCGR